MMFKGIEICCPHCKGELQEAPQEQRSLNCLSCDRRFPIILDIPDLRIFPDPYIDIEADRTKGRQVAARFDDLSFAELVDFYYSITSVVPPHHAQQYTRGLMAAPARAEAALASWERTIGPNGRDVAASLLEIGCGTAPLLEAAAPRFAKVVGVDIAFRWLVVAKKRLAGAGLDVPLICACAEALPFPDSGFDRIVADSVIEHLHDQHQALGECHRLLRPGGYLCMTTPNRYSVGPDPHVGIWAGGYLPERWLAAYVRRQGGIPPKRRLLSARSLSRLVQEVGFCPPRIMLPDVPEGQRSHFGRGMQLLIDLYHTTKRLPVSRQLLHQIGPLLHAISQKPGVPAGQWVKAHTP
jgi:SAM-dependent methyltransferase